MKIPSGRILELVIVLHILLQVVEYMYIRMEIDTRGNGEMVRKKGKAPFGWLKKEDIRPCIEVPGNPGNGM